MARVMWGAVVIGVLMVLLVIVVAPKTDKGTSASSSTAQSNEPLEYQMAVINAGGYVSHDDVTVTRFAYLLDTLTSKTSNTRQQIADLTVNGQNVLRSKYGKDVKLLDLMEAANRSIAAGVTAKYAEVMAVLVMLYGSQ
jgi:hypothetical protein